MSDVPHEILREILSRLPVVPLLRFRCVSMSWKSLIEDQQFIKHHMTHSQKTNSNLSIILQRCHIYSLDFDVLNETSMAAFKELSHPLIEARRGGTQILGSCDGLLVLRNDEDDVTILWNPSARRFHEIPFCGTEYPGYYYHGFGYDVVSDDYKLIRIIRCRKDNHDINFEVKVYSLKSDSWRKIPDFPDYIDCIWRDGVLANGTLHWIVRRDKSVPAFDLGTEEFSLVPLPKFAGDGNIVTLVVLGGCFSLLWHGNNAHHFDIWVMKEYGVQKSWSILFTVSLGYFQLKKPLAYSKCGRKVLLGLGGEVLCYDLDKKSTDDIPMVQMPSNDSLEMFTCLQSLVLSNNGTCDFDLVAKIKQEGRKQKL